MSKALKRFFKKSLLPLIATGPAQPIFKALNRASLIGLNIGAGSDVENSGELHVLRKAAELFGDQPEIVVFDVGANFGDWTMAAANVFSNATKIHCFEPSRVTRERLTRNVSALRNIAIHPIGLGSTIEELTLIRPEEAGCASLYERISNKHLTREAAVKEVVSISRVDEVCRTLGITRIDFIKLDIEGHELAALNGCGDLLTEAKVRFIQFEFGGCNIDSRSYFHDFWMLLNPSYEIFRILPRNLYRIRYYNESLEQFTTTNYLAIAKLSG